MAPRRATAPSIAVCSRAPETLAVVCCWSVCLACLATPVGATRPGVASVPVPGLEAVSSEAAEGGPGPHRRGPSPTQQRWSLAVAGDGHLLARRARAFEGRNATLGGPLPAQHLPFPRIAEPVREVTETGVSGAAWIEAGSLLGQSPRLQEGSKHKLPCHVDKFAPRDFCPSSCPFAAELQHKFCHFMCVESKECGKNHTNKEATIPDKELHQCRRCSVAGCAECVAGAPGEDIERCKKCMPGYFLNKQETCGSVGDYVIGSLVVLLAICLGVGLVWYVHLWAQPVTNEESVAAGLRARERALLLQRTGEPYPLTTNLCSTNLAGAGCVAIFRFQMALLVWVILLILVWVVLGLAVSTDIFIIGTMEAKTPQEFCAVINWGRRRQMELVWVKCLWLAIAYLGTFMGALFYAYQDKRLFLVASREVTMCDFGLICRGLPDLSGDSLIEEKLRQSLEQQLGEKIVGLSCCWDFHHHAEDINKALEADLGSLEQSGAAAHRRKSARGSVLLNAVARDKSSPSSQDETGFLSGFFGKIQQATLLVWGVSLDAEDHALDIKKILRSLRTTDTAFIVFDTAGGQQRALEAAQTKAVMFEESALHLEAATHEPEAVLWQEFAVGKAEHAFNVAKAYVITFGTSLMWTVLLYLPYAHYMASFSYANGDKPGEWSEAIFVGLVTAGNLFICIVARMFISTAGYRFLDDEETAYTGLYTFALLLNLVLDMLLTAYLSYRQMVGVGVHTADGRLLKDLVSVQQVFESYPMQKSLGNMLFKYCWPATFLLPFVAEPLVMIWLPLHIGCMLVRSDQRLRGKLAEQSLAPVVMEQTRYGDLTFNIVLIGFIPLISPAYMLWTFGALCVSHFTVYLIDHWKVLRGVVRFHYSRGSVSEYAQAMFAIPTGLFLAGLIFKSNQMTSKVEELGSGVLQGSTLAAALLLAPLVHILVHLLLLKFVIPWLALHGQSAEVPAHERYEDCARHSPCTWFSSNPVHCLRSKHLYEHDPPHVFHVAGKEHLLQKNPALGAHYEHAAAMEWAAAMAAG